MSELVSVILAAGKGTRMKSKLPKVLHKVGGLPMVEHVLRAAQEAGASKNIAIIGFGAEKVEEFLADRAIIALQKEQLGTGHAVLQAAPALEGFQGTVMILCGDTPLLEGSELKKFYEEHLSSGAAASVLTAFASNPTGYGRILRDATDNVEGIVEEKDASAAQKAIKEINTGIYCVEAPLLFEVLATLTCDNAQGEYYLTDILTKLKAGGKKIAGISTDDFDMVMGINARTQLAVAERIMRDRVLAKHMDNGVTIMDPASTYIDKTVVIGGDTVIYPNTWLEGATVVGEDNIIGPNVRFTNVKVGEGNEIHFTYGHDCEIMDGTTIGPYVHLRPNTVLSTKVHVGNFVEVKNSNIGEGTKLPHLTYIGDTDMGARVNMGCGCITVNYDGKKKHRTTVEDDAFVGCNTNLVAPVKVGKGAYVGAGSTITKEVEAGALAVGRSKQKNIQEWATKYKEEK